MMCVRVSTYPVVVLVNFSRGEGTRSKAARLVVARAACFYAAGDLHARRRR